MKYLVALGIALLIGGLPALALGASAWLVSWGLLKAVIWMIRRYLPERPPESDIHWTEWIPAVGAYVVGGLVFCICIGLATMYFASS